MSTLFKEYIHLKSNIYIYTEHDFIPFCKKGTGFKLINSFLYNKKESKISIYINKAYL